MKKKAICLLLASALFLLAACGGTPNTAEAPDAESLPQITDDVNGAPDGASEPDAEPSRQDGERYEGAITLEGMEQTVPYEHIVNQTAGFEMDYDYEKFVRHSEADRERFISIWDDPENPEYFLEVTYSQEDAETVAAAISEELSTDYEITRGSFELDHAGSSIRISASEVKGGGYTADQMQIVYIIPTDDGCRIATAHYGTDSADLFGARFRAMVSTLSVIDR